MLAQTESMDVCEHKYITQPVQTLDSKGSFEGYASLFNIIDMGRDIIQPGAFQQCLTPESCGQIKMLWQHDVKCIIGHWVDIYEDRQGLFVKGQLNLKIRAAQEALALMEAGEIDGLSIGFRPQRSKRDQQTGVRTLSQIDLVEISIVTFPMMPKARIKKLTKGHKSCAEIPDESRLDWLLRAKAFTDQIRTSARNMTH
jgi:HK97 family phage prohead protease